MYSINKKIYSVDMMITYINIFKPKIKQVETMPLFGALENKLWGDPRKNNFYSPLDVIRNKKKYKNEMKLIQKVDLKYPIIISNRGVVDGFHRLAKAYLTNKKKIKAVFLSDEQMELFLINKRGDWDKVSSLRVYDYIKLFHDRFHK